MHSNYYVLLLAPPCTENEVRLQNDLVQICHNGVSGYVCAMDTFFFPLTSWTDEDARVVCRELGFIHQGLVLIFCHIIFHINIILAHLTGAKSSFEFSFGAMIPFFLSEPNCNGFEEHLIDCPGSEIQNITSCFMTAVAYCAGKIISITVTLSAQWHLNVN